MSYYVLHGMCDEELSALISRLEEQTRSMRQATTSMGRKLAEQYEHALQLARLERDRRACDE